MNNIKIIVTDLDDTLLRNDKSISDYSINILKECQAKGIKIVFATARSTQAVSSIMKTLSPDILVSYGGSLITINDGATYRFAIPADTSWQLINECVNAPDISYVHAINENIALTTNKHEANTHYKYVTDFTPYAGEDYLKISVNSFSPSAVEEIARSFPMCDMLRYTGGDLYRFASRQAIKWNAVKTIANHYNISINDFICFGDDYNDYEMIQNCGIGVAMANAINDVKNAADYICQSNEEDGVAKFIEAHILSHSRFS